MAVTSVNQSTPSPDSQATSGSSDNSSSAFNKLNLDQFLKLMISELQNQDPLNPTDNDKMLAQLAAMRQIGATDKLSGTLDSVLLGQSLANAGGLIGKQVSGLSDDAKQVSGTVDKVSIDQGAAKLHIGDATVPLANVTEVLPAE